MPETPPLPAWALTTAGPPDRLAVQKAQRRGKVRIQWRNNEPPREWAKQQGWPTPWFGFAEAFVARMLESEECFALALSETGVTISIPKESHSLSDKDLENLDALYQDRSWAWLVEELREIRRAVEAGVVVHVEGARLTSFESFYKWAHGRYHALEEAATGWIGDDKS
jgi:hypothetical protein